LAYRHGADPLLRLETLIWGADEMTLIVPAWLGYETVSLLLRELRPSPMHWRFTLRQHQGSPVERDLSHAIGLVFCHQKAPIQGISRFAGELAEWAKDIDRTRSGVAYAVLESFDRAGNNVHQLLELRTPAGFNNPNRAARPDTSGWFVPAAAWPKLAEGKRVICAGAARRQLRRIVFDLFGAEASSHFKKTVRQSPPSGPEPTRNLKGSMNSSRTWIWARNGSGYTLRRCSII